MAGVGRAVLGNVLTDPPPQVSTERAATLARQHFGVAGSASALDAERDRNFHIRATDGSQWVLKVVHPSESPAATGLQNDVLLHIAERDPWLPIPRVLRARNGEAVADAALHPGEAPSGARPAHGEGTLRLRMYSFLPGQPLAAGRSSPALRRGLGTVLGRLDRALTDFAAPSDSASLAWDAGRVLAFRDVLRRFDVVGLDAFLDHFHDHALPLMARARRQWIHNDLNPRNVIVADDDPDMVVGVIDFGDMMVAPVIQDLATACAYHVTAANGPAVGPTDGTGAAGATAQPPDEPRTDDAEGLPLIGIAEVVSSYQREFPLDDTDFALLPDLLRARLLVILAITGLRLQGSHTNRDYIARNVELARAAWTRLAGVDCSAAAHFMRERSRGGNG